MKNPREYKNPRLLLYSIYFYQRGQYKIAHLFEKLNSILNSCEIHCQISLGEGTVFMHSGRGCIIHENTQIGNNVRIFQNVTIGCKWSNNQLENTYSPIIEDNVMIGAGAVILGNIIIGENSIIGANSVVTHSVPSNSVVGGVPAKIIKSSKHNKGAYV